MSFFDKQVDLGSLKNIGMFFWSLPVTVKLPPRACVPVSSVICYYCLLWQDLMLKWHSLHSHCSSSFKTLSTTRVNHFELDSEEDLATAESTMEESHGRSTKRVVAVVGGGLVRKWKWIMNVYVYLILGLDIDPLPKQHSSITWSLGCCFFYLTLKSAFYLAKLWSFVMNVSLMYSQELNFDQKNVSVSLHSSGWGTKCLLLCQKRLWCGSVWSSGR